jgi:hypothetical protein
VGLFAHLFVFPFFPLLKPTNPVKLPTCRNFIHHQRLDVPAAAHGQCASAAVSFGQSDVILLRISSGSWCTGFHMMTLLITLDF